MSTEIYFSSRMFKFFKIIFFLIFIKEQNISLKGKTFDIKKRNWVFVKTPNFRIPISLQSGDVNLWYFKPRIFDLTEFIVWNIKALVFYCDSYCLCVFESIFNQKCTLIFVNAFKIFSWFDVKYLNILQNLFDLLK